MLVVNSPFANLEAGPRIISEVRKNEHSVNIDFRPKLSGELLVKVGGERRWWPRRAIVKSGQLFVSSANSDLTGGERGAGCAIRLPLRQLSLRAGALPNSLSLCRGPTVVLTIQTASEQSFDIWVKTIAIELIRQTPLEDVKYLDIFTFTNCYWKRESEVVQQLNTDYNSNYLVAGDDGKNENFYEVPKSDNDNSNNARLCGGGAESQDDEKTVENLLKKCQNSENYVPVKEKLILFESLCKLGRKVRSTEDVSCRSPVGGTKRARSLHDLSNYKHQAVREICKYFEVQTEEANNNNNNNFSITSSRSRYGTISRFSNLNVSSLRQKCAKY